MIGPNYCVVFQLGIWDAGFGRKISPSRDGPSDFAICDEVVGTFTPSNYSHTMYLVGILPALLPHSCISPSVSIAIHNNFILTLLFNYIDHVQFHFSSKRLSML